MAVRKNDVERKNFSLQLDVPLYDEIDKRARENGRSMGAELRLLVASAYGLK